MEGSGDSVKYYAQLGADAGTKKLLGNGDLVIPFLYTGSQNGSEFSRTTLLMNVTNFKTLTIDEKQGGYSNLLKINDTDSGKTLLHSYTSSTVYNLSADLSETNNIRLEFSTPGVPDAYLKNVVFHVQ